MEEMGLTDRTLKDGWTHRGRGVERKVLRAQGPSSTKASTWEPICEVHLSREETDLIEGPN